MNGLLQVGLSERGLLTKHATDFRALGWFQWYCRFFQGRRGFSDRKQVDRWKQKAGTDGHWRKCILQLRTRANALEQASPTDLDVRIVQQTCLHWAYEPTQQDEDEYLRRVAEDVQV